MLQSNRVWQKVTKFGTSITELSAGHVSSSCNSLLLSLKHDRGNLRLNMKNLMVSNSFFNLWSSIQIHSGNSHGHSYNLKTHQHFLVVCTCITVRLVKSGFQNTSFKLIWFCYILLLLQETHRVFLLSKNMFISTHNKGIWRKYRGRDLFLIIIIRWYIFVFVVKINDLNHCLLGLIVFIPDSFAFFYCILSAMFSY